MTPETFIFANTKYDVAVLVVGGAPLPFGFSQHLVAKLDCEEMAQNFRQWAERTQPKDTLCKPSRSL